jgi:hypothetical protein
VGYIPLFSHSRKEGYSDSVAKYRKKKYTDKPVRRCHRAWYWNKESGLQAASPLWPKRQTMFATT